MLEGTYHPAMRRTPSADVKPVDANSAFVTTGTAAPPKAGADWNRAGGTDSRASPAAVRQRRMFSTRSPSTRTRYPTTPCTAGGVPVMIDDKAVAVVVGATDVIGPPSIEASVGATDRRSCNWFHPTPSRTSSTTCDARAATSGSHGAGPERPWSAGTTLAMQAPA
jgi:hypothetical protein